jgi:hypothetical protein
MKGLPRIKDINKRFKERNQRQKDYDEQKNSQEEI